VTIKAIVLTRPCCELKEGWLKTTRFVKNIGRSMVPMIFWGIVIMHGATLVVM